jgi:dTMP kinase
MKLWSSPSRTQYQIPSYNMGSLGKFIVFEGGEGGGKDTQIELLQKVLPSEQYIFVRDPGSTEIGHKLREMVLHDQKIARTTELLMYLAARVQLAEEKIKPALAEGVNVISNRFDLSTIAYQIYGRERLDLLSFVKSMSEYALGGIRPDIVILLDVPPEIGLKRALQVGAPDRFESEKLAFHERVRQGYLAHINEYPSHHIIDATQSIDDVTRAVRAALGV